MTQRIGNHIIIEVEPPDKCELCGRFDELRPYGPNGKRICFSCGMKNEAETERNMHRILLGEGEHEN